MVEHTIADRAVPCSNHGRVFFFRIIFLVAHVTKSQAICVRVLFVLPEIHTSGTSSMGFQSLFLAFLYFIAAAHAGQLTVQSPRLTVFGSDGDQLRSEVYATHLYLFY